MLSKKRHCFSWGFVSILGIVVFSGACSDPAPATKDCPAVDDGNPCTIDTCNEGSVAHEPAPERTPCSSGGNVCDGMGACVACVVEADCPQYPCGEALCASNVCGYDLYPPSLPFGQQIDGDCATNKCRGLNEIGPVANLEDLPNDGNPCTEDICMCMDTDCLQAAPAHPPVAPGTACGMSMGLPLECDGNGNCIGCTMPNDCPGIDDECQMRTCINAMCGMMFTVANTPITTQTGSDCLTSVCDGQGHVISIADDLDIPQDDGNTCTSEMCVGGMPQHPGKADGATCGDGYEQCVGNACTCSGMLGHTGLPILPAVLWPRSEVIADFDGDGKNDIAAANRDGTIGIYRNLGNHAFAPAVNYLVTVNARTMDAADFNGDGHVDLAIGSENPNNMLDILLNQGDGTFAAPITYPAGMNPIDLVARDVNGDGKSDVAVLNYSGNLLRIFINQGNGTFAPGTTYSTDSVPKSLAAADFNGDGRLDFVTANSSSANNTVSILMNQGNGTFAPKVDIPAATGSLFPQAVATGDFNGDGKPDLAVGMSNAGGLSVMMNQGNGTFGAPTKIGSGFPYNELAAIDMNGDGKLDIVGVFDVRGTLDVFLNLGNGSFGAVNHYNGGADAYSLATGDLDGDMDADIVVGDIYENYLSVVINRGDGTPAASAKYPFIHNYRSIMTSDFNGDGQPDFATANDSDQNVSIIFTQGAGTLVAPIDIAAGPN
ncbi:MAG TPA: VCBS repeat-containing protein, partial [Polyangium sp.]|nr:VCBS repeat-containing protein [Polyangium sp.]